MEQNKDAPLLNRKMYTQALGTYTPQLNGAKALFNS